MYKKYKSVLISGSSGSGKTTMLKKFLDDVIDQNNVSLVLIEPKTNELEEYTKKSKCIYINDDYENQILNILKPMIEERLGQDFHQMVIAVDEYAYLENNFDIDCFFDWMFKNKKSLNIVFMLTSQQRIMEDFDIEVKMK